MQFSIIVSNLKLLFFLLRDFFFVSGTNLCAHQFLFGNVSKTMHYAIWHIEGALLMIFSTYILKDNTKILIY